jgi:hypothetical protein
VSGEIVPVCKFIRVLRYPVMFFTRTLRVYPVTQRSPVHQRKIAWLLRKHPELYLRRDRLELILPGHAVIDFHQSLTPDEARSKPE